MSNASQTLTFSSMPIIEPIQKALAKNNYKEPTPIQEQAIPALLDNRNLLACSQTGTGKTASFIIPILQQLSTLDKPEPKHPQSLVLTPTRELAEQISKYAQSLGRYMHVSQTTVYGGVKPFNQIRALKKGTSLLIATPGRFLDLMEQGYIKLGQIRTFVLDEADRMLDMGFLPDIKRIHGMLPEQHQCMLFSATMPPEIDKLSEQFLKDPVRITIAPPSSTVDRIEQQLMLVDADKKLSLIEHLLEDAAMNKVIVFTRTKYGAQKLAKSLYGIPGRVDAIHGDKSQKARQHTLRQFKENRLRVLIATDVASRGIDVDNITHVINYDLPEDPESYVHRIGRTGRAGATGIAMSFCTQAEWYYLTRIEKEIDMEIPRQTDQPFHNDTIGPKKGANKKRSRKSSRQRKAAFNKSRERSDDKDRSGSSFERNKDRKHQDKKPRTDKTFSSERSFDKRQKEESSAKKPWQRSREEQSSKPWQKSKDDSGKKTSRGRYNSFEEKSSDKRSFDKKTSSKSRYNQQDERAGKRKGSAYGDKSGHQFATRDEMRSKHQNLKKDRRATKDRTAKPEGPKRTFKKKSAQPV